MITLKEFEVILAKSGIKIKKANRGKFTEYCGGKVTSECIARGKNSPDPKIRKRATFAANARKWKHLLGGKFQLGGLVLPLIGYTKVSTPETKLPVTKLVEHTDQYIPKSTPEITKESNTDNTTDYITRYVMPDDLNINKVIDKNTFRMSKDIYKTKFTNKDIPNFTKVMSEVYSDVLDELKLPKTNLLNLVRQAAIESNYGTDPRGNGYNLGGIKNFGTPSKGTVYKGDNISYMNFNDLKDFATYKIKLLNDRYDAIKSPENEFVSRLHGNNKGKYSYSASKDAYAKSFENMKSLDSSFYNINKKS